MAVHSHEDLEVWQNGIKLLKNIYLITEQFPAKERFRLVDQMCRAAISIPSNIAEGSSRKSTKEFMRFIAIALGSLAELKTQIVIARELGYLLKQDWETLMAMTATLGKQLHALYKALERRND